MAFLDAFHNLDVQLERVNRSYVVLVPNTPAAVTVGATCPVLQYADDILILVRADIHAVQHLKHILDSFAAATGLKINFHKSTVVPMNVVPEVLEQCLGILECREAQFPQSYLGLPLSHEKLKINTFVPMIAKADRSWPVGKLLCSTPWAALFSRTQS